MNPLFALSCDVLPHHMTHYNGLRQRMQPAGRQVAMQDEIGLLVAASDTLPLTAPCCNGPNFSLWATPFGEYARQKEEKDIPTLSNWIGGAILAFDYQGIQNAMVGIGAAYAFSYVHLAEGIGHSKFNQEFMTLYGSWEREHFCINAALWGGCYQMYNERHSIASITSTSNTNGWLFSPHLEISVPYTTKWCWFAVDPLVMFDWANNWQGRVREHGASGFNIHLDDQYTSILRSEIGVRFFETLQYGWGSLILEEKVSYVNKTPFHTGAQSAFFVTSISSFAVETFSSETQNLGLVGLNLEFSPWCERYPYGNLSYQGEFGSTFQSQIVAIEIGKDF